MQLLHNEMSKELKGSKNTIRDSLFMSFKGGTGNNTNMLLTRDLDTFSFDFTRRLLISVPAKDSVSIKKFNI